MPAVPAALLDIHVAAAAWRRVPNLRGQLQKAAQATLDHLPKNLRAPFTATVLLTGNARVKQLNRDFRGIDQATNVLSFPQQCRRDLVTIAKQGGAVELGDIALAYGTIAGEAKANRTPLTNHMTHLVIHGLLHLWGYDHIRDNEADAMEKLETRIMAALGLPDPYAAQTSTHKMKSTQTTK